MDDAKGASGNTMSGAGVHSGRDNKTTFTTYGCIRTTDDAMKQIKATVAGNVSKKIASDPLKTVTVKNNGDNVKAWQDKRAVDRKREEAAKKAKQKASVQTEPQ